MDLSKLDPAEYHAIGKCPTCKEEVCYPEVEGVKVNLICEGCGGPVCGDHAEPATFQGEWYTGVCQPCRDSDENEQKA